MLKYYGFTFNIMNFQHLTKVCIKIKIKILELFLKFIFYFLTDYI